MNISEYSVKRPVTVVILFALLLVIAAIMVPQLAVDMFPDTTRPVLTVYTGYSGAGPEDVEANVTIPLENALAGVTGLEGMSSTSGSGSSRIRLDFGYGTDLDASKSEVESILAQAAGRLPEDAGAPSIFQFNMSSIPIMQLVVRGDYTVDQLRRTAEEAIAPRLERIEGVASTSVSGGSDRRVDVEVSLNRLAAHDITLSQIASALSSQNILVGAGSLIQGVTEYQLLTSESIGSVEELERTILKTRQTAYGAYPVRLQDVADVRLVTDTSSSRVFIDGQPGVYIQVQNESGTNSVQISRAVRSALEEINGELPRGMTLEVLSDTTTMINATLGQVYGSAVQGALLAMAVLLVFLRNIKGTFIIGLSIPISILITLMCMALFDLTLNLLTLTGLVLGLGMIVDGSIVILENIHEYRARGAKPAVAAILGSQEMFRAIVSSTTTTLCVFIPVIIFKNDLEMMGELFSDLVFTVVISLVVSLAVALIVVPALAGPIMALSTRVQKPLKNRLLKAVDDAMEHFFTALETGYRRSLEYCLSHRLLIVALVASLLAFSVTRFTDMGLNLFPRSSSDDSVAISVTMPPGTSADTTQLLLERLQEAVRAKVEGYESIILTVGWRGGSGGRLEITLPPPEEQTDTPADIRRKLADDLTAVPGAQVEFSAGRWMGSSSPVDVEIRSDNPEASLETAEAVRNILLREVPGVEDPLISLEAGGPQLRFRIDRERAAVLGVSAAAAASELRTAVNGSTVTAISDGGESVDVRVALRESDLADLPDLEALFLVNGRGEKVPLANIASIQETRAPSDINREDRQRIIHVTASLAEGASSTLMQESVRAAVEANLVPREGVAIAYGGEARDVRRFGGSFIIIIIAAIVLVFGVMASQFESFVDPFIIFFSIPPLFIGVIWIYRLTGEAFSLFSAVGVVALVGIVVNNGIVLVDYTNTLRARGYQVRHACTAAGASRLRPILMTTLTTILGMVPLAFFPGEGAETIQPIGKTIVGGLAVSSVMTLFLTPVMYSLVNRRHDMRRARRRVRLATIESIAGEKP